MFGTYQHSNLRIEVKASADEIGRSLTDPSRIGKWLRPQEIRYLPPDGAPSNTSFPGSTLQEGQMFESTVGAYKLGLLKVTHQVEMMTDDGIRLLLSGSIDGFHEWQWGDGWVQSRLEGVSLLPLNLGQTASLVRLRFYLQQQ